MPGSISLLATIARRTVLRPRTFLTYLFVNERNQPFDRMGIARMIEGAGETANSLDDAFLSEQWIRDRDGWKSTDA